MSAKLHIPTAPCRPGDEPDFSAITLPAAGELARPDEMVAADTTRELSFSMIRVLDEQHQAVGPWAPALTPAALRDGAAAYIAHPSL